MQNGCFHFLQAISTINYEKQVSPLNPWQALRRRAGAQQLSPSSSCYFICSVSKKADVTFTFYFAYDEESQRATTETLLILDLQNMFYTWSSVLQSYLLRKKSQRATVSHQPQKTALLWQSCNVRMVINFFFSKRKM